MATFQDLTPGASYKICEVTQAGWVNSDPGGTAPFCKTSATLVSGVTPTQLKFGNYQPVDLTVLKYHDLDASGGQNGSEAGLSGWVFWIDADNDGVQDALETTATTIAGGVATFQDLTPGASYKICEVTQAGWVNSDPGGTAPFCKTSATLVSGVTPTQLKFGNYQPVDLTVLKYHDLDASGGQNGSEAGLSGWVFWTRRGQRWRPGRPRDDGHHHRRRRGHLPGPHARRLLQDLRGHPGRLGQLRPGRHGALLQDERDARLGRDPHPAQVRQLPARRPDRPQVPRPGCLGRPERL